MSQVGYLHIIQSEISQERSKIMNFYKRSYQPILRYLYTEAIKRQGEISLHKHFNCKISMTLLNYKSISLLKYKSSITYTLVNLYWTYTNG